MANLAAAVTTSVSNLFTATAGNDFALNAIAKSMGAASLSIASVMTGNTPPELLDLSLSLKYPTVHVYCDKLINGLKEKFRVFSGITRVVVEIRYSQDQIQNIQAVLESYVAAACEILDDARGDWGGGMFYAGGYEVSFGPVKKGGTNFLQIARVALEVDISE